MKKNINRLIWEKIVQQIIEHKKALKTNRLHRNAVFDIRYLIQKTEKNIPHP